MTYLKKVIKRLREGALKEIWRETKWIYHYAVDYRRKIFLYIAIGLATTIVGLASGFLSRELINAVTLGPSVGRRLREFLPLGIGVVTLALLRVVLKAVSGRVTAKVNLAVNREIRADIFKRFLKTDWESISRYHSGDLMNRIHSDVSTVAGSVLGWVPSLITSLVQFFASLAIIVYYDPVMGLITLCTLPVSTLIFGALAPKLRAYNRQTAEASARLTSFYTDCLQNIQSVKAFDLVDNFCGELDRLQGEHMEVSLQQNRFSVISSALMSVAGMAGSYICLAWGVLRLWRQELDFGTLVLFIQLAGYLSSSASAIIGLGPSAISTTVAAKRIMSILDLPREEARPEPRVEQMRRDSAGVTLELQNVAFSYADGEEAVLEQVNFVARPGEVVAIVGPSGSGKTTMLRLLLSLLAPTQGSAFASTECCGRVPLDPGLRSLFAYVPQEKALFSGTVAQTLRLAKPEATEAELWQVLELTNMAQVIRSMPLGLDSPIGQDGAWLSEGQGQRLSIARALLRDAPILLLDEATSALDVATERQILRNIMARCSNKTCVVTSHRPSVLTMCSCVYRIQNGRAEVLDQAGVDALLKDF